MSLKELLDRKLAALREINDQPERFLSQFFATLRNDIVIQTEALLCKQLTQRPPPSNQIPWSEHERIVNVRKYFSNGLSRIEKELIERIKLRQIDWTSFHVRLAELTKLVEDYQPELGIDMDNVFLPKIRDRAKHEFDSIHQQLESEIERVKRELFNSQTIFFEPSSGNGFGVLVVFDGLHLDCHEVDYLRSSLNGLEFVKKPAQATSIHLERRDLKPLFKFLKESINKPRQVQLEQSNELRSNVLVLEKFSDYISKCIDYSNKMNKEPLYHVYIDSSILSQNEPVEKPVSEIYFDWNQLDLSGNQISGIHLKTFSFYTHLKRLDLSSNNLKELKANIFDELVYLSELSLASNQLCGIDKNVFGKMKKLRKLDLSHNMLDENMLAETIPVLHLKKLDLSHNRISALTFKNLVIPSQVNRCRLRRLNLSNNFIENLTKDSFVKLERLKSLDLSHNRIGIIVPRTFKLLSSIQQLSLSSNGIAEIRKHHFKSLSTLRRLVLSNNLIGRLEPGSFKRLTKLETLFLDTNEIDLIGSENLFESNKLLQHLNLAHNSITGLSSKSGLAKLEGLKMLKLNHNPLAYIGPDSFKDLRSLRQLYLNNCLLSKVDTTAFQCLDKLDELYLNKNPLCLEDIDALNRMDLSDHKFKVIFHSEQKDADCSELSNSKISEICSLGLFF